MTRNRNPVPITGEEPVDLAGTGAGELAPADQDQVDTDPIDTTAARPPVIRNIPKLIWRTIVNAWNDGIVGWAAQSAFWQSLSLPPLLLGVLGSIGYVGDWFGPDTLEVIHDRIVSLANKVFTDEVVGDLIVPTVDNVLSRGKITLMSTSFVISLWAGSSAVSCFIASIVYAHKQHEVRNPVWQRIFALLLYIAFLLISILLIPLVALGPNYLRAIVPPDWDPAISTLINWGYFPLVGVLLVAVLTALYHFALPSPLPWHRLMWGAILAGLFFWLASYVLRYYLAAITRAGYTYGALATPIAFLLFTYFLGFAIVVGAEFNATIQKMWPARPVDPSMRTWVHSQTTETFDRTVDRVRTLPQRLPSGPIRRDGRKGPEDDA